MGGADAPSLTDLARRAAEVGRVGTKGWGVQIEQKDRDEDKKDKCRKKISAPLDERSII